MENSNNIYQMRAVTRHIEDVPKEWESTNAWDSHRELLWLAVNKCIGNVIEVGCGDGSTMLLRNFCKQNNEWFISLDNNKEWADKFDITEYVEDLIGCACSYLPCAVLFIDFAPGELRKSAISEMCDDADVIVIHDTEPGAEYVYGMKDVLSTFKYRLDYQPEGKPHTTAVSNTVNVCLWI